LPAWDWFNDECYVTETH